MTTFPALLDDLLRRAPGRPLVTWYDEATGERTELSVATYANWVAKTASLLVEEHDLERGSLLRVDLPAHWLGPVFLGAAWLSGMSVVLDDRLEREVPGAAPHAVVCGPAGVERWAGRAPQVPVLACSLLPLGVRFADPLPAGVHDVGVEVWSQPDSFVPWDPPAEGDVAVLGPDGGVTQGELWSTAAAGSLLTDGGRLLSEANPASPPGVASLVEPLAKGGSLVLVSGAGPDRLETIEIAERCTARFPRA
ncbi:TIGR03089 family protein [Nocardioides sp. SYSU D00038]|uniref:TIGR03089 family protein n=1 Tax=Nocardioides sp. SYSU D00038 TaxID=2812554 RepID=UPI001966D22E|nr:TIGR03089 family protein [Nocardioides sp. SYSU D00038]